MSAKTYEPEIVMLCTDLGLLPENLDDRLEALLQAKLNAADRALRDAGLKLNTSNLDDLDLLVSYASWLYRGRVKQQDKPLMLQRMLNNRQVSKATKPNPFAEMEDWP